ncbi:MAG: acyl carrier protein [Sciscionella sp.]
MSGKQLTIEDLRRILRDAAGDGEGVGLDGDFADVDFADLGYDSIVLLEIGGRIERECGITLDEDTVTSARTPRTLLAMVHEGLATVP